MVEEEDPTQPSQEEAAKARAERWNEFARAIVAKRKEAVDGRKESGIEDVWARCEEHYHGIDDANRHEFRGGLSGNSWTKPTTLNAPLMKNDPAKPVGATGFVRLTSRYVDAGAAKLGEITIPVDGKLLPMKATPVPDLIKLKEDLSQVMAPGPDGNLAPQTRPMRPDEMPPEDPMAVPQGPQGPAPMQGEPPAEVPLTVADLAEHALTKAEESAKAAETRIHDWLTECSHAATLRKVEFDMARIGVGVLKGPIPDRRRSVVVSKGPQGTVIEAVEKTVQVTKWIDPWNLFPDPGCGENVHAGDYILEREFLSRGRLEDLRANHAYVPWAIEQVLKEGPDRVSIESGNPAQEDSSKKKQFTLWHFTGRIRLTDLEIANEAEYASLCASHDERQAKRLEKEPEAKPEAMPDVVHARVTLVNDTPIRVVLNPLEKSGGFPYHAAPWCRRAGSWAGVGPAEQLFFPQKLINAATRAGMTNMAKSADPVLGIDDLMMNAPARVLPGMVIGRNSEWTGPFDIRQAMTAFEVPNTTAPIMQWVEYALKLAEESTNIPLITQGQSGDTTPDTFSGQQLQDSNANQLLRDVGYSVAENISNPLGTQMYEVLLLDPDVPDTEKGDHQVDVAGAIAMIEKALQDQALMLFAPMTNDPGFGFDKRKVAKAFVRAKRWNPNDLMLTDEEFKKASQQPPPPPPQIAVAQIRAESAEKIAQSRDQLAVEKIRADTDRDTVYNQVMAFREQVSRELGIEELRLRRELALLDRAKAEGITLAQAKTSLAETTMKLQTTKELHAADLAVDLHKHHVAPQVATPPVEPPGRAAPGQSYEH